MKTATPHPSRRVWLFDLDNTLHDASHAAFGEIHVAMTDYMVRHLELPHDEAWALRQHYWKHYGATLLGLVRHHGVKTAHFLAETHRLPGLEQRLRTSAHDRAARPQPAARASGCSTSTTRCTTRATPRSSNCTRQ